MATKKIVRASKTKNVQKSPKTLSKIVVPKQVEIKPIQVEVNDVVKKKRRTRKAKSKSGMYFTTDTENAIVEYNNETDHLTRGRIFETRIKTAFEKIAENIFNTFKFSYNEVCPESVQREAISHMVMNMSRYDQTKGKAFGYFSIVAKNWFILENNMNYRRFKKHVEIIDEPGESTSGEFIIESEHDSQDYDNKEFIELMVAFWDENIPTYFSKERDQKIAGAVVHIFRQHDRIDIFNKKALYLYIREISGCQTQHITKVINKMMYMYKNIKDEYMNSGKITGRHYRKQNVYT